MSLRVVLAFGPRLMHCRGGFGSSSGSFWGRFGSILGPFGRPVGDFFAVSEVVGSRRWFRAVPRRAEVRFDCTGAAFSRVRVSARIELFGNFLASKVRLLGSFWEPIW